MGVRLMDIAKEVGVSEATVSLALNNKTVIKEETRRKIWETAERMGYRPNVIAKTLVKQKSNVIGLVITDFANVYFGQFVKSCVAKIVENGYQPLIASSQDKFSEEERVIDQFISQRVAGIIIIPPTSSNLHEVTYLKSLETYGIRYLYATAHYTNVDAPYVMVNLKHGSYLAVKYLLDMGHRRIYFLGAHPQQIPTKMRFEGYKEAFAERGLEADESMMIRCENADFESSYVETLRLVKSGVRIDAITTINDIMALGSLRALRENGLRVPEDLSLIGYDDIVFSDVAAIPLTTVHQDIDAISRRSVNLLINMIQNDIQRNDKILIEPHLVVRNSTGVCSAVRDIQAR